MSKRNVKIDLQDILEEIESIKRFTKDVDILEEFSKSEMVFYSVLKALENIGEAVKNIPEDKRSMCSINLEKIAGLRDILIQEYFGVDVEIIWEVIEKKLTELE